jgi:hypothetical protein
MTKDFEFDGSIVKDLILEKNVSNLEDFIGCEISDSNGYWVVKDINKDIVTIFGQNEYNSESSETKRAISFFENKTISINVSKKKLIKDLNFKTGIYDNYSALFEFGLDTLYYLADCSSTESILKNGILSRHEIQKQGISFNDISLEGAQWRRENRKDKIFGRSIHSYVPLYYLTRTPMLDYQVLHMNKLSSLIFFCIDTKLLLEENQYILYSNGNLASPTSEEFANLPEDGSIFEVIINVKNNKEKYSRVWNDYDDGKRKVSAEVLIHSKIEPKYINKIICYNEKIYNQLNPIAKSFNILLVKDPHAYRPI